MSISWNICYINPNTLAPGQFEPIQLPEVLAASGTLNVIKEGSKVYITDIKIRSVSSPLADDPSAHVIVLENDNPVQLLIFSFNARDGWHPTTPILVDAKIGIKTQLAIVCSSLSGSSDSFLVQAAGFVERQ